MKYIGIMLLLAGPAAAQEVRDFAPDRPSRSDSPITVPATYVQVETDFFSYTHTGQQTETLDPTLKYGLSSLTDIEVQLGGLESQRTDGVRTEGFGDVTIRAKISLLGDDGGDIAIGLIPYAKIPTAREPIGNGAFEYGLNAPVLFQLPLSFQLTVEPEISVLKNELNDSRQASFTGILNLGRKIVGDLSGFVEVYGETYTDRHTSQPQFTFDYGLAYMVTKTLQLDAGANVGLNRASPSLSLYSGIAARF